LTGKDDDQAARLERARAIGLFRYMPIREAADPSLTGRQRGSMVRAAAAVPHADPDGRTVRITRWTLDRWIKDWRKGGFDAAITSGEAPGSLQLQHRAETRPLYSPVGRPPDEHATSDQVQKANEYGTAPPGRRAVLQTA
jgi:hypothetical protein